MFHSKMSLFVFCLVSVVGNHSSSSSSFIFSSTFYLNENYSDFMNRFQYFKRRMRRKNGEKKMKSRFLLFIENEFSCWKLKSIDITTIEIHFFLQFKNKKTRWKNTWINNDWPAASLSLVYCIFLSPVRVWCCCTTETWRCKF